MIVQTALNALPSAPSGPRPNVPEGNGAATAKPPDSLALPTAQPPAKATRDAVQAAADNANASPKLATHNLQFRLDEGTDRIIIKVVDKVSGEVLREIPPEEMLAIAESLEETQKGLLLSQEA